MKLIIIKLCVLLCIFFCTVNAGDFSASVSNASGSLSETIHTVKDALDIKKELDDIRKNRKGSGTKRTRRHSFSETDKDAASTVNKVTAGIGAFLKTYLYQPIAHGNFLESTIRGYSMFSLPEGRFVFATLDGDLNQSFKDIMNKRPRTGDIISCRIPGNRMAEHYMMVVNNKISEVGVRGGKSSDNGVISFDSYRKSNYLNSTECLHHENRIILRAEKIDEKNGADTETDLRYQQILQRLQCTVNGKGEGKFKYDLMSCNCQDVVMYWAYGYMENNCVAAFFNGCENFLQNTLFQISGYVDEKGELKNFDEVGEGILGRLG